MMNANDFKNVNEPKDCEVFSPKRSEQEVLVLPPNLLQQLGIHLGSIGNNLECLKIRDPENDLDKFNDLQEKPTLNNHYEISITETKKVIAVADTAISIKKSVLSSQVKEEPWPENRLQNKNYNKNFTSKKLDTMENILDGDNNEHEVSLFKNSESIFPCLNKNVHAFVENEDFDSKSSTCLNIESSKSKIDIISQEFSSAEKINNLKLHSTDENSLIPFSINKPIKNLDRLNSISRCCKEFKYVHENNEKLDVNNLNGCNSVKCNKNKIIIPCSENITTSNHPNVGISQEKQISSVLRLASSDNINSKDNLKKNETIVASEDSCDYREKNNNFKDNKGSICYKEKNYDNIETCTITEQDHECTDIADNKVKEIANYLCQYFLPAKANISPKRFVTKSKISIQGVEKPGGMIKMDNYKYKNTYQNKKKNSKAQCNEALFKNFVINVNAENLEIDDKINDDPCTHCIVEQLCVCQDFGKLQFYDSECEYQHIHFWQQNNAQSSSITLFEIYNSDCTKVSEENHNDNGYNSNIDSDFNRYDLLQKNCYTKYLSYENDTEKNEDSVLDELENPMINVNEPKFINFVRENTREINNVNKKRESQISYSKSRTPNLYGEVEVDEIDNNFFYGYKRKRLLEEGTFWADYDNNCHTESRYKKNRLTVKCAVCTEEVSEDHWEGHLSSEHCYISWKVGNNIDLNDKKLLYNLTRRLKEVGVLKCTFCGKEKKFLKKFMKHIKICLQRAKCDPNLDKQMQDWKTDSNTITKCGVCSKEMYTSLWLDHIATVHNYQAWTSTEPPLDLNNQQQIQRHLQIIIKQTGELVCAKCGLIRKHAKSYMQHIKTCNGNKVDCGIDKESANDQMSNISTSPKVDESLNALMFTCVVKCGVCHEKVNGEEWLDHIHKEHNYLARIEGVTPLDENDEEAVRNHLHRIRLITGYLTCAKCGLKRKVIKKFLQHIKSCDDISSFINNSQINEQKIIKRSPDMMDDSDLNHIRNVKCAVCGLDVEGTKWLDHIHEKHNYLAWIEGKPPIDIHDEKEVRRHLDRLKKYVKKFICNKCGQTCKFVKVYMQHVKYCDGGEVKEGVEMQYEDLSNDTSLSDLNSVCLLEDSNVYPKGNVKCGVCQVEMDGAVWLYHIQAEHNYLARVEGKPSVNINDTEQVKLHLYSISKQINGLVCSKCGLRRKYVKAFLQHIKNCEGKEPMASEYNLSSLTSEQSEEEIQLTFIGTVVCGVCKSEVNGDQWIEHIHKEHNYLAHVEGNTPLNLKDEKQIQRYLNVVCKHTGGLYCSKCGLMRMYVKSFLRHISNCDTNMVPSYDTKSLDQTKESYEGEKIDKANNTLDSSRDMSEFAYTGVAKCGVCLAEVRGEDWINHIQKEHNYLAWIQGKNPLDLENFEQVHTHLYSLSKIINGLTCKTCGIKRKYVKSFLDHIDSCSKTISERVLDEDNLMECAICSEKVTPNKWKSHAMNYHYNITWATGMEPIDLRNPYMVEKYLKEYKQANKSLVCKICKTSRVSCAGFYAHIITCGKTEEEIDFYKSYCDICNCKYLCIYKNQHLGMHREQVLAKEKKENSNQEKVCKDITEEISTPGRRKAAERAHTVIENYINYVDKYKHKCSSCGFGSDLVTELEDHSCEIHSDRVSDSDVSIKFDGQSEEESDSDVDSNISMEEAEEQANKKKRYVDLSAKVPRLLSKVNNASHYVSQGAMDFFKMHYTVDMLFPQWITSEYQELDTKDFHKYLPSLDKSCKVRIGNEEWTTYKRFEAKKSKVTSLFAGGSIRCVMWVPVRADSKWEVRDEACGNYLAVASHTGPDAPRLPAAQVIAHRSLVQLWHFADFIRLPAFVLGIAHDYGTVWAMDWCPSGVRDHQPDVENKKCSKARLGLLAIACSNGSAYILVVPYPNVENVQNPQIIKVKPSAELRLCKGGGRNKYQATAICWSQQKGHSVILVGYADGTTAFYNFDCDSPLLKTVEDGVTIIYPFQDDRPHNTCISDVGLFPSDGEGGCAWGAWSGASCTGAHAALFACAPRLHTPLATASATFTPHWPSVIVTADEAIANHSTNELEWHGGGRRLGGQRALATCLRCGLGVAYVPPVLRITRTHPAYKDQRRDIIGLIHMAPIAKKRSKHVNDDLSMKVEPLIYEDAIKEYGLEFKLKIHMDKGDNKIMFNESKQHFPERFPLADVTSMSFCKSLSSHTKLAVATHAGLVFIVNI